MEQTKQPPLLSGDMIGVMAPSSFVERGDIEASAAALEARGYRVFVHPQTYARDKQSAGSHADKVAALHALWRDPEVKAIWAAGGGNRALHLMDGLDYELIKATPKPLIGFSDVTVLLNALYVRAGVMCIHGLVFRQIHGALESLDRVLALLEGGEKLRSLPLDKARVLRGGQATGPLIGGNLSLFQYLPQTLFPDSLAHNFWDGAILCLEDCNEELSRLDRMILHLKRLGVLTSISGLILGEFSGLKDSGSPFGRSLENLILEHMEGIDIPIVMDAPFGHGAVNYPLPIGGLGRLSLSESGKTEENRLLFDRF